MSAWPTLPSLAIQAGLSDPVRRVREGAYRLARVARREPATLEVFLRLADPASLLVLRSLPAFVGAYDVSLRLHWIDGGIPAEYEPNAERRERYLHRDTALLCRALDEPFADAPLKTMHNGVAARLTRTVDGEGGAAALLPCLNLAEAYWAGDTEVLNAAVRDIGTLALEHARQHQRRGVERLLALGHYETASVYFDGTWFTGIDRLGHLYARLDRSGAAVTDPIQRRAGLARLRKLAPTIAPQSPVDVVFYFSFRSPFSYLAAETCFALADAGQIRVDFRPVLPMVKRGQPLPTKKRLYLVKDANREARRLGIAFGRIADPLNAATNCIRIVPVAEQAGRIGAYVRAVGRACWADGIDLRQDDALIDIAVGAGLGRTAVKRALTDDAALATAERNMQELNAAGLWGVPSFRIGESVAWGQDRLALLMNDQQHPTEMP